MLDTARPYAYIRKSTKGGPDSKADQIARVREVADRNGASGLVILDGDWGISAARDSTEKRLAFLGLMEAVERGEVSALYAADADRLARSRQWAARLADACEKAGVLIHTPMNTYDLSQEGPRWAWHMAAASNEEEVRKMSVKAQARVVSQRARGVRLGQVPYGHDPKRPQERPERVAEAFRAAGTYHGAARLLNDPESPYHAPSRRSHLKTAEGVPLGWEASSVKRVLEREAPDLIRPVDRGKGLRMVATHYLSRLLVCEHDGSIMTTMGRAAKYACRVGHRTADHPRPWVVAESVILPRIREASETLLAVRAEGPGPQRLGAPDPGDLDAQLEDLRAAMGRLGMALVKGLLTEADVDAEAARINADIANLEAGRAGRLVLYNAGIDWDAPAGEVNARLREIWTGILVGHEPYEDQGPRVKGQHVQRTTMVPRGAWWRLPDLAPEHPDARQEERGWYVPFTS